MHGATIWTSIAGRIGDLLKSNARRNGVMTCEGIVGFLSGVARRMVEDIDFHNDNVGMVKNAVEECESISG